MQASRAGGWSAHDSGLRRAYWQVNPAHTLEQQSDDDSIHDKDNTYTWDGAFASKIATLNSTNFAGHDDWRVPNLAELLSIATLGATNPSTFAAFQSGCTPGCTVLECSCTKNDQHFSSSTYLDNLKLAWTVYFFTSGSGAQFKSSGLAVRAVRGGG